MSADNYYIIKRHPGGGYAAVMGFASDEHEPRVRPAKDPRFDTVSDAVDWAGGEYSEYGVRVARDITKDER